MRALLTSAGIKNSSIHDALIDLLDKPIAQSHALFIPTGVYPFPGGPGRAWRAICGKASPPLCELGAAPAITAATTTAFMERCTRPTMARP